MPQKLTYEELEQRVKELEETEAEHKRAKERLIESERKYRALFENMTAGFVLFEVVQDAQGVPIDLVILAANRGFETTTGLKVSEVTGKRLKQVLPGIEKDIADWIGTYGEVALTGTPRQFEQRSELLGFIYSITAYQAGPKQCGVTFQEISERKRAEEALRQSEQKFRALAEFAPVGIVISDLDENVIFVNKHFTKLFGYTIEDMPSVEEWWPHAYPDASLRDSVRKAWFAAIEKAARSSLPVEPMEYPVTCRDGSVRHIEFRLCSNSSLNFVIMTDVSKRKVAETIALKNAEDLRITLQSIGDAVITTDMQGRITRMNRVAEALTDWISQDAENQPLEKVLQIVNAKTGERVPNPAEKVMRTGRIVGLANDTKLLSRDGNEYQISNSAAPVNSETGGMRGVVLVIRDVTESYNLREAIQRERNILQTFVKHAPAAIAMMDTEMRYLSTSDRFLVDYGIKDQELIGRSHYEIFPEIPERWKEIHRRCLAGAVERCDEDPFPRANGKTDWVRWEIRPWYEISGEIGGILLFSEVITERKITQDALLESERKIRFALETAGMGGWDLNLRDHTAHHSELHDHIFGYSELLPEWSYERFLEHVHPDDRGRVEDGFREAMAGGREWDAECRIHRSDGSLRWIRFTGRRVRDGQDNAPHMAGLVQDITDRKRDEERLEHINRVLEAIRLINKLIVYEQDRPALLQKACNFLIETSGYKAAWSVLYDDDGQMVVSADSDAGEDIAQLLTTFQNGWKPPCYDLLMNKADGVVSFLSTEKICSTCPLACLYQGGATLIGTLRHNEREYGILAAVLPAGMVDDENEHSLFEELVGDLGYAMYSLEQKEKRVQAEELYGMLFNTSTDGILIADAETKQFKFANPAICKFLGYTLNEMLSMDIFAIHPKEHLPDVIAGFESQASGDLMLTTNVPCLRQDGSTVYADISAVPVIIKGKPCLAGFFRDITARKRTEEEKEKLENQLLQAQKMESVGRLAGGVAHDYNNMLNVILGYTEMALEEIDQELPLHGELTEVMNAARRSAEITRQLLAFARKQTIAPKVLDLNDTIGGMLKMLQRLLGENISLSWNPKAELWHVKMDPSQIDQILANLCVNARDAIADVGRITIETDNIALDEYYCTDHAECMAGEYVMLAVSDNGSGMDQGTLKRIFEPYYTTKDVGKGTGLGMSTVYGIVKQNSGSITIYSEPGKGTTIRIYIPRHLSEKQATIADTAPQTLKGNGETLLLVEDEVAVRKMGKTMLERSGYIVLTATSPGEAFAIANRLAGKIDLLITDLVMPEMNGKELAKNLKILYPQIKVLFMSGYTANVIAHHGVLDDGVNFIQKPFSKKDLNGKVHAILNDVASRL